MNGFRVFMAVLAFLWILDLLLLIIILLTVELNSSPWLDYDGTSRTFGIHGFLGVISKEGSLRCLLELHGFWQQSMRASRFDTIQVISKEGSLRCLLELHGFWQQSMRASRFDTIQICPLERPKINHLLFPVKGGFAMELNVAQFWSSGIDSHEGGPDHIPGLCIPKALTLCCLYFCRNSSQFVKPQPEQSKDYSSFKLERKEIVGSFGPKEDAFFHAVTNLACDKKLLLIYLAANSGARIGAAEEIKSCFKDGWSDEAYQPPIEPLLNLLCLGIQADRLANKALYGVYANDLHV
ncbi:hypothetical protein ZIOFF_009928 [Zingiber officinale]|uniref:Acetyl-coenzyme A carboxylase carboxyl transferase subunit beta domain-containing protein n=1 Tax=Zingiber officinale TaxID=94328 RepID=A0A8J5HGC5_ZINOF|nr:hypothetical protein ZIOFF_009928 [Zingiber officinale]